MTTITYNRLRELLHYDPAMGIFTYKRCFFKSKIGRPIKPAKSKSGHLRIGLDGQMHSVHRLAWLYMTGQWPPQTIDHKDLDPTNNKFDNLRLATRSQNKANSRKRSDSTSPYKGVYWGRRQRKWGAHIKSGERRLHLGYFETAEAAHLAYAVAAQKIYGEFARAA